MKQVQGMRQAWRQSGCGGRLRGMIRAAALGSLCTLGALGTLGALVAPGTSHARQPAVLDTRSVPQRSVPSTLPEGWQHGVFMEIFVRAYQDSDGDGHGDLRGLTRRLDYLKTLGVSGLWLMPIMPSSDGDHGYATTHYRQVDPQYGRLSDLDELLKQAHARGIGVIVDYVINHSAAEHPAFKHALAHRNSPYRAWYMWQNTAPKGWDIWGKDPWTTTPQGAYFATFGPHMPDFNLRHGPTRRYHEDSLRFWLNRGLDGFRLDAVPHLVEHDAKDWNDQPESRRITADLRRLIQSYGGRYTVCEATANPVAYGDPAVCGAAFAFGLERAVVKAAQGDASAVQAVASYFESAPLSMATMVSNHDIFAGERLWDQLGGDERRYRLAAATYLLLPGTPFIYYGEEIGMGGLRHLPGDEPLRGPMSWAAGGQGFSTSDKLYRPLAPNAAQQNAATQVMDPGSLFHHYRRLIALRQQFPALARGAYVQPQVDGTRWAVRRELGSEQVLVAQNHGDDDATLTYRGLAPGVTLLPVFPTQSAALHADAQGQVQVPLPALGVRVFKLQP